ncbi:unnamed protein product, partial [Meganyctiphanes norvegica]
MSEIYQNCCLRVTDYINFTTVAQESYNFTKDVNTSLHNVSRLSTFTDLSWAKELGVPTMWLQHHQDDPVPDDLHVIVTVIISLIGILGTAGNAIVLWVFTRFRRLRSPANTFIVNLAFSDLICSVLHSMAAYSSYQHRWSFGQLGCSIYGGGVGLLGLVSIVTLSWIAVERFIVIRTPSTSSKWRITRSKAKKKISSNFGLKYLAARRQCTIETATNLLLQCTSTTLRACKQFASHLRIRKNLSNQALSKWKYFKRIYLSKIYMIFTLMENLPQAQNILIYNTNYKITLVLSIHGLCVISNAIKIIVRNTTKLHTMEMISSTSIFVFTIRFNPFSPMTLVGTSAVSREVSPSTRDPLILFGEPCIYIYEFLVFHRYIYTYSKPLYNSVRETHHSYRAIAVCPRHVSVNSVLAYPPESMSHAAESRSNRNCYSEAVPTYLVGGNGDSIACLLAPDVGHLGDGMNLSEPELIRYDERVVPAHIITYAAYHREKRRFIRSSLFCSESSLERYIKNHPKQTPEHYYGGGGGLLPTTAPNAVLEQTGPSTWDHVAVLKPSIPLNSKYPSSSPPSNSTRRKSVVARAPRTSVCRELMNGSHTPRHSNCCECAAGDLANTVTVATMKTDSKDRRRSSTIHVLHKGNMHSYTEF